MRSKAIKIFRFLAWFIPAALVFAAGFAAAYKYDIPINKQLYSPGNLFAQLMEAFGWYPIVWPTLLLGALILADPLAKLRPSWRLPVKIAAGTVLAAGYFFVFKISYGYLINRGILVGRWNWVAFLLLTLALELVFVTVLFAFLVRPATRIRLQYWALCGTALMFTNLAVINTMKFLWQRTRFDDMMNAGMYALDHFTNWTQIQGYGGSSFPSGHTANAACILMLVLLCDLFSQWAPRRGKLRALCWLYIGLMAFSRILIGRHYLSDTLAAAAIIALLYYILFHNKFYRRGQLKTLQAAHQIEIGETDEL